MFLSDVVSFRKDLLFNGAVQVSWIDDNPIQANKAAQNFVFHGPSYHGVAKDDLVDVSHRLIDTASFTYDIAKRLNGSVSEDPFMLAIAGYGTGKSHLAVTLSALFSNPSSETARQIVRNLKQIDGKIGNNVDLILEEVDKPYLVVTINGMKDFNLSSEITKQILAILTEDGIDTTVLENLRPRFKVALNFTKAFFDLLKDEFLELFGPIDLETVIHGLETQDEGVFKKISEIYSKKMGSPIHAAGQESLHDFIKVAKENYCGEEKPYAGILILFDEFGRYLEFSVQQPYIAGSGALQQLFECVQANEDAVMLVGFIQYELKAYISRVAPELREDLNRYVTRYDSVQKVRLSTNIETLIANLLNKKELNYIQRQLKHNEREYKETYENMREWFPELRNHSLWNSVELFNKVVCEGCWPMHPLSTWTLYKLSTIGKSLQQRSALALLADVYDVSYNTIFKDGKTIVPIDFCNEPLINEFVASERYGQQGALANAYLTAVNKYQHELRQEQFKVLKAVLLSSKIGFRVVSKKQASEMIASFSGLNIKETLDALEVLEKELAVLEWNEQIFRFEITGDAVPRKAFISYLQDKVLDINSNVRSEIFVQNYLDWAELSVYSTDFGTQNQITTQDWKYAISLSNVEMLSAKIDFAVRNWQDAIQPNDPKGQLIYCYVGQGSKLEAVIENARATLKTSLKNNNISWSIGAPIALVFLDDREGVFGDKLAEYWVINNGMGAQEKAKYEMFIGERKQTMEMEMKNVFATLEKKRHIIFATDKQIPRSRIGNMLDSAFESIYPKIIPFDFDGFGTVRGNAIKDARTFTTMLLENRLDKEWIATAAPKERNRAHAVLVESWEIFASDGTVRLNPQNSSVRELTDLLAVKLENTLDNPKSEFNLGEAIRAFCAPPYGCNLASAGLVLALFIGARKEQINFKMDNTSLDLTNWASKALPKNLFELSVLDATYIEQISGETLSEWTHLLENWELEQTILGALEFERQAEELQERFSLPQQLFYRHKNLSERTKNARNKLRKYERDISDELDKIARGMEREDLNLVAWGGSSLVELHSKMSTSGEWTQEQLEQIELDVIDARNFIQDKFESWLPRQKALNVHELSKFSFNMGRIGENLVKLDLLEEKEKLEKQTQMVNKRIEEIENARRLATDVQSFVAQNVITNEIKLSTLKFLFQQIQEEFVGRLETAKKISRVGIEELLSAETRLAQFQKQIHSQMKVYQDRMLNIYNITELNTAEHLRFWRREVTNLMAIYEGEEQDIADLIQVDRQLELFEKHFGILRVVDLSNEELERSYEECLEETKLAFNNDAPPLDAELIYEELYHRVKKERLALASAWLEKNLPKIDQIQVLSPGKTQELKSRLRNKPAYLSEEKIEHVEKALKLCDQRLDELEVQGLLARYYSLSSKAKRQFLNLIIQGTKENADEIDVS